MNSFVLLKQSFPTSKFERKCDVYEYVVNNIEIDSNIKNNINPDTLNKTIKENEKYLYRVGKENGKFKDMCISLHNYKIIREFLFKNEN